MSQPQWKKKYAPVKLDHRVAGWGENWNTSWGRNHHLVTILAGVSIQLKYIILVVKIGLFLGSTLQKSEPLTYYRSMLKNLNYPSWTLTFNTCYWYCFPLNQCIGTRIPGTQPSSWAADFFWDSQDSSDQAKVSMKSPWWGNFMLGLKFDSRTNCIPTFWDDCPDCKGCHL